MSYIENRIIEKIKVKSEHQSPVLFNSVVQCDGIIYNINAVIKGSNIIVSNILICQPNNGFEPFFFDYKTNTLPD